MAAGRRFLTGRTTVPPPINRTKHAAVFFAANLPTPPASVDYRPAAAAGLADALDNWRIPDCTAAAAGHIESVLIGNAGKSNWFTTADADALYPISYGYPETTTLDYWKNNGLPGGFGKCYGWTTVDSANKSQMQTVVWLFENVFLGLWLPDAWVNPEPSYNGFIWDIAGPGLDPHDLAVVGYNSTGVIVATWGMTGTMTWAALAKYGVCAYTILSQDGVDSQTGKFPNGFSFTTLQSYFDAIALPPSPVPPPAPPPAPPSSRVVHSCP